MNDSLLLWDLVKHFRANQRFLNHDLRGILGRGIGWARLLPESLKNNPPLDPMLKEVLEIFAHLQSNLEKSLEALDKHNHEAQSALKIAWVVQSPRQSLNASRKNEWLYFEGVTTEEILNHTYRPELVQIESRLVSPDIQIVLDKFEVFGTQIQKLQ